MTSDSGSSAPNDAQIRYWNGPGADDWTLAQDRIELMLAPFDSLLLDYVGLEEGQSVLDVGCGCGSTSLAVADVIGPDGSVIGVDVSTPMLDRARIRAGRGSNINFIEADAQTTDFKSLGVDHIVSRFGVMFFDNPVAAFSNIATAGGPGARLSFLCWRSPKLNPWFGFAGRAVRDFVELPRPDRGGPGPFAMADHEVIAGTVLGAGFADLEISEHEVEISFGGGGEIDELVDFAMGFGPVGRAVAGDDDQSARARDALTSAIGELWSDRAIRFDGSCWLVQARV
ncbi:MAG: methyltransferase domain-containing protein [Actinomycetia bacterium]|nr:methyltransferase domain-containing protein [Actinomycetes bacterium]MCP4959367.1 methyltransferase domain-containing protein [Actinomycetes bacterium]